MQFSRMSRWDPASYEGIAWNWPESVMASIGSVLRLRKEKVDPKVMPFSALRPITIHFDGSVSERKIESSRQYTMDMYWARPRDIVVAKIDLKNGAVSVIPDDWCNVAVTNHFAVYEPDETSIVPEYLCIIVQVNFFKAYLNRNKVGAEGRKEVKLDFFESIEIPLPPLDIQRAIVQKWEDAQGELHSALLTLANVSKELNKILRDSQGSHAENHEILKRHSFALKLTDLTRWDLKTARATIFRNNNPAFRPMGEFVEEATEMVKPWESPDKEWPVYGVNNINGVFFSHYQKGKDFNASYKIIRKEWFFHNPTRSSVGSLGMVPEDVMEDAITSPEYQVWRIKQGLTPEYVAALITTPFFISLIQFHRVGAVKQRLYVENLLQIPIPVISDEEQRSVAEVRKIALMRIRLAKDTIEKTKREIEKAIMGDVSIYAQ